MSEIDNTEQTSGESVKSPGQLFEFYILMEELLDKLKMLNYDKEFVKDLKQKAITRHYFAIQTNPGEQFYMFACLAAWLVRKSGSQFEQPQEYDDPNSTISAILDFARQFGATVYFPPSRLKQGYGEQAVYVLNCLVEHALKITRSSNWPRAEPREEATETVLDVNDDSELVLEKLEEEMAGLSDSNDDDDEENVMNLEDLRNVQLHRTLLQQNRPEQVLQSSVRSDEWQTEVERVLPQLRVTVQADSADWRSHLELMQKYRENVQENLKSTKPMLEKIQSDIRSTLEKIDSREKHVNGQLEQPLLHFADKKEELRAVTEQFKLVNSGVTDRSHVLSKLTDQLEAVKKLTEERSSGMTDGSPLINAKKAVTRLKKELKELDVRLGVLDNEIVKTRLRHKNMDHVESAEPILAY